MPDSSDHTPFHRFRVVRRWLICGRLTDRQLARIARALDADEHHDEVTLAWRCAQQVRAVYHAPTPAAGRALADKLIASFPSCPVPEITRLGKTCATGRPRSWPTSTPAAPATAAPKPSTASSSSTAAIARGFRHRVNNRLRMLLIAGGLNP